MSILTQCIRSDPEYRQLLRTVKENFRTNPLPVLASGLCEGASDAFLVSLIEDSVKERGGSPALIVCAEEKDCVRILGLLESVGLRAAFYMARDLTLYNITASHEYEHERLRVLSGILSGDLDAVVTTPDAALGFTLPPSTLCEYTVKIDFDSTIDIDDIAHKLTRAGYPRVES